MCCCLLLHAEEGASASAAAERDARSRSLIRTLARLVWNQQLLRGWRFKELSALRRDYYCAFFASHN